MMSLSGLAKFLTGFLLAIAVLFYAGVSTARYLIVRFKTLPPKPIFANERPEPPATANPPANQASGAVASSSPTPPNPTQSPTPDPEPGAYEARVTQPIGLVVRQEPSRESAQIGGVGYSEQITILGESSDGEWLKVRLSNNGTEGWISAGNVERIN